MLTSLKAATRTQLTCVDRAGCKPVEPVSNPNPSRYEYGTDKLWTRHGQGTDITKERQQKCCTKIILKFFYVSPSRVCKENMAVVDSKDTYIFKQFGLHWTKAQDKYSRSILWEYVTGIHSGSNLSFVSFFVFTSFKKALLRWTCPRLSLLAWR